MQPVSHTVTTSIPPALGPSSEPVDDSSIQLSRKRKSELRVFIDEFKESSSAMQKNILQEIMNRVIPTPQDLPKELRGRTMVAISEAIKASTSTPEEMAVLYKLQQALEKTPSLYFGSKCFYSETPSLSKWQKLIEEQRENYKLALKTLETLEKMEDDKLVMLHADTTKSMQEQQNIIAALRSQLIPPPAPHP